MELQVDDMVAGEISFVGEADQYTFFANAGETVLLRVADTQISGVDSGFTPRIELFDSSGREIDNAQGNVVASLDISLTETGVYTYRQKSGCRFTCRNLSSRMRSTI